jgi:hypothetical protein
VKAERFQIAKLDIKYNQTKAFHFSFIYDCLILVYFENFKTVSNFGLNPAVHFYPREKLAKAYNNKVVATALTIFVDTGLTTQTTVRLFPDISLSLPAPSLN